MLTIQSNLKIQDLETLGKTLIKPDIINFSVNKAGGGYSNEIADRVIAKLSKLDKDKAIVIINDITLQMTDKLLEAGYKNIYLAFGSFNKDGIVSKDKTVYNIMKAVIENNIKEKLNAISLEEIFNMKFNLVIANPPYGKIGANITKKIIDDVEFDHYINLLPLKDYKHSLDIANHINYDSITIMPPFAFGDADTITAACSISKQAINNIKSIREFVSNTYVVDEPMSKFMKANCVRTDSAIDNLIAYKPDIDVTTSVAFHCFMIGSNHNSGWPAIASNCTANKYNFNNEVADEINKKSGGSNFRCIKFNTPDEKINFMNFVKNNFSFCNRLQLNNMLSGRDDSSCFIKVDWTRSDWTVEKILKEVAFYTDEEIKAVLDSDDTLHNYWGDVKFLHDQFPNHF